MPSPVHAIVFVLRLRTASLTNHWVKLESIRFEQVFDCSRGSILIITHYSLHVRTKS